MSKYYKAEDIMEIFSDESRPYNWMGTETEIQEQVDFDFYKSQIESLPTIEVSDEEERTEWVKVDKSGLKCSKCGSIFRSRGCTKIPKHCPECGTKTIGVE